MQHLKLFKGERGLSSGPRSGSKHNNDAKQDLEMKAKIKIRESPGRRAKVICR